jgi:hypothetical protein
MSRVITRIALLLGLLSVLWIGIATFSGTQYPDADSRALLAALLAVVAAIVSAWTSQRTVEFQEDQLKPNLIPQFDLRNRYLLAQFQVTNLGGSSAYDVEIVWDRPLLKCDDSEVKLGTKGTIPALAPGASASVSLGVSHEFMSKNNDTTYEGTIKFRDSSGRRRSKRFVVSAEHERNALTHDREAPKTHYQLQRIPDALEKIRVEISNLRGTIIKQASREE